MKLQLERKSLTLKSLASGDRNGGLYVWEAQTGNLFYTLKAHTKSVTAISWRSDSNVVSSASEDGSIRLWEMNEGKQVKNWTGHGGGVLDMTFTGDGRIASCGRDKKAKVWDANGTQKMTTKSAPEILVATSFNHDGTKLISGSWDGTIQVYDTNDGKLIGNILGNPPHIASRIKLANSQIELNQQNLNRAKSSHQESLAKLNPLNEKIESLNKQLEEKKQNRTNLSNQLTTLKTNIDSAINDHKKIQQQIEKLTKERSETINLVEKVKDDPEQTETLQTKLSSIEAETKIKTTEAEKIKINISALEPKIKNSETSLAQLDKEIIDSESQVKVVSSQKQSLDETIKEKLSELNSATINFQRASSQLVFWNAHKFNHERHQKLKERSSIADLFNQTLAEYDEAKNKLNSLTETRKQKEKELQDIVTKISENEKSLQSAVKETAKIEARINIDRTILEVRKNAMKTIEATIEAAPEEIKKVYIDEINLEKEKLNQITKRMSSNENLVGVLIPNAKDELSKSSKLKQDIETQIQSIVEKEKKHLPDLKNLEASHAQSEQRLKSFDSLTQKMYKDYLNMLPKS